MKFKSIPSQKIIRNVLDYNPITGIFTWKAKKENTHFDKTWNKRYANTVAGTVRDNGYLNITIDYEQYRAHRLAWVYVNGDGLSEEVEIDHKNTVRNDNRIENLRLATKSNNGGNSVGKSRSGLPKGVEKNKKVFSARIMINGVRINLGTFPTPEEAHLAYCEAAKKYHGEFARAG